MRRWILVPRYQIPRAADETSAPNSNVYLKQTLVNSNSRYIFCD